MKKSIIIISLFVAAYAGVKNPRGPFKRKVKSPVYIVPSDQNNAFNGQAQNQKGVKYLDPFMFMQKNNHTGQQAPSAQQGQNNQEVYQQYGVQGKPQQVNQTQMQYGSQQNNYLQQSNTPNQMAPQLHPLQNPVITPQNPVIGSLNNKNSQFSDSIVNNNKAPYNQAQKIPGMALTQANTVQQGQYQTTAPYYTPVQQGVLNQGY
jgi:hypothetical protein